MKQISFLGIAIFSVFCAKKQEVNIAPPVVSDPVSYWVTNADQSALLKKQTTGLFTGNVNTGTFSYWYFITGIKNKVVPYR